MLRGCAIPYLIWFQGVAKCFIVLSHETNKNQLKSKIQPPLFQVALNFREKSARPGDNITLSVSGSPGSLCSISMVDKSVYLHGGSNILQTTSLMKKLESYDLSSDFITDWQYCSATSDLPPVLTPVGRIIELDHSKIYNLACLPSEE